MRTNVFEHQFVSRIPNVIEKGILYVCLECNVIVHLCPCGCGEKVVIILAPEHWKIKYNGEGISIYPSIGNTYFSCRSHYYIRDNKVEWLEKMHTPVAKQKQEKKSLLVQIQKWLNKERK